MARTIPSALSRLKGPAIATGVALLTFAAGYGVAWFQSQDRFTQAEEQYEQQLKDKQQKLKDKSAALKEARVQVLVLSAHRQLHLSALALESRNFGTADQHMQKASEALTALATKDTGHSATITKVKSQVSDWKPDVAEDVGQQRQEVLGFAQALAPLVNPD